MDNDYKVEQTQFGEKISHPSYGTLRFSRITGSKTTLFGSSIEHRDTVLMELYHADITRELHSPTASESTKATDTEDIA